MKVIFSITLFAIVGALYMLAVEFFDKPRPLMRRPPKRVAAAAFVGALLGAALWCVIHGAWFAAVSYARWLST